MEMTESRMREFTGYQQGELDGVAMYQVLAKIAKEKKVIENRISCLLSCWLLSLPPSLYFLADH